MRAIYRRELQSFFHTMVGYVFIAFLVAFTGIYFMVFNLNYGYPYFSYVLSSIHFVFMIAVPVLTMRSFAEDRKNKTDQMLLTAPVGLWKIVLGKYLAMVSVFAVPCVIYLLFPLIIMTQGTAYIAVDYLSILVFFIIGCVYIAIGMFLSSLTESPVIAAISAFGVLLLFYLWSGLMDFLPGSAAGNAAGILILATVLVAGIYQMTKNWLIAAALEAAAAAACAVTGLAKPSLLEGLLASLLGRFSLTDALTGIAANSLLDVSSLILDVSLAGLFLFMTMQMIQKRRWS